MSLRAKFTCYLVALHLVLAAQAGLALMNEGLWLLGVEVFFVLSLALGIRLFRHFWTPLRLLRTGAELIEEGDFASKFVEVGQPEMDQLIRVFNRMNERLREVNNSTGAVSSLIRSCLNYRDQVREADREDFATALQVAAQRSERLGSFMRNFSEVVKLPAPRLQLVNLVELLRGIERLLQVESQQRYIAWNWEVEDELPPVRMDREQLEQVFVNILKNAMEAIGKEGRIGVRMGRRPQVVIADSGCGIAPEVREQLFTPFFSTKEQGQGIGLTLVQEILGRHGFEFSLESRPGGPTEFAIYF